MTDRSSLNARIDDSSGGEDLTPLPDIVSQIVETMRKGQIESLVLSRGDFHLELKSTGRTDVASTGTRPTGSPSAHESAEDDGSSPDVHVVTSPMIGTFYVAPAPGEKPFVRPGDTVSQGDTIGIVEAMKIMNEIAADRSGTVLEVAAEDGDTVEYGSPLVRLQIQS